MSEPEQNAVVAFLLVYSGRPNPSWPLDQGGVAEVATRLAEARGRALRVPPPQARLGYQGFRIENRPGVDGLPPMLLVGGGAIVEATEKGDGEALADVARLETWLLEDARNRDYDQLLREAGAPPRPD
ncbi:MAG TPA: hypothetical protein VE596_01395 [Gaiellaceae bacterium]|jgi:hypothetical protein|nr:hypothetical protein [Gaiellaceae bacterium]